mmetsp:Transcript_12022/g.27739  ORF Transcript_12022/g.27739 Transcript_12022/m.27739 type:complete len:314 (-) Transcript_12022:943-1884(-)
MAVRVAELGADTAWPNVSTCSPSPSARPLVPDTSRRILDDSLPGSLAPEPLGSPLPLLPWPSASTVTSRSFSLPLESCEKLRRSPRASPLLSRESPPSAGGAGVCGPDTGGRTELSLALGVFPVFTGDDLLVDSVMSVTARRSCSEVNIACILVSCSVRVATCSWSDPTVGVLTNGDISGSGESVIEGREARRRAKRCGTASTAAVGGEGGAREEQCAPPVCLAAPTAVGEEGAVIQYRDWSSSSTEAPSTLALWRRPALKGKSGGESAAPPGTLLPPLLPPFMPWDRLATNSGLTVGRLISDMRDMVRSSSS